MQDPNVTKLVENGKADLQQQFESFLSSEQGMDPAERQELARLFQKSMDDVAHAPESAAPFDRNAWRNTVESLQLAGGLDDDDAARLIRSLNDALDAFESTESKVALEFSKRVETHGQAEAVAWLRTQQSSGNLIA